MDVTYIIGQVMQGEYGFGKLNSQDGCGASITGVSNTSFDGIRDTDHLGLFECGNWAVMY